MNPYTLGPIAAVLDLAEHGLNQISLLVEPFAGADSTALAIIVVTLLVRLLLVPVALSQARAQLTRQRLSPRISALRAKYRTQPERLRIELAAVYAEAGASPLAGLLPLLAQAPVVSLLYALFVNPSINGHANVVLAHTLLEAPLATSFAVALQTGFPVGLAVAGVVLVLLVLVCVAARAQNLRLAVLDASADAAATPQPGADPSAPAVSPVVARVVSWMPLLTVVFAGFAPLAAALYLLTTTTWSLGERRLLHWAVRRG